ncbi:MAG TPA: LuxR C-terminal-related transcriptional regulator, partial [Dehalococcoidia bacterium]|nr:LuxR C-terminal-related transcriptional regulator [Dehalococcoidia bacterium]
LTAAGQAGPVLARHAAYFLVLADRGAALSLSQERIAWLDRLEAHIDDLRQAMQWLLDARASEAALRLAAALLQLCWVRGYMSEGRRWLQAALAESARVAPLVRAAALRAEGQLAYAQGDFAAARLVLQASIAQFEELGEEAGAHAPRLMLGAVYWEQGRFDESRALYETILANARRREDHVRAAEALVHVGLAALGQGQFAQSRAAIAEALGLYGRLGLREQMYIGLGNLGALAHAEGNLVEARGYYEAALAGLEETGFQLAAAAQLDRLAEVARREGQLDRAWAFIERSLQLRARLAARAGIAEGLATAGMIAAAAGEPERAARLLGAAEARRQQIGMALLCFYQEEHDRLVTALRNRIGANRLAGYWAEGAALSQEAALALVERPLRARGGAAVPLDQGRLDIRVLDLTEREREVLRLVAADRSNKEIGRALGLSVRTVEQHLRNVYAKLDVQGRAGATAVALRLGLVSTPRPGQTLLP